MDEGVDSIMALQEPTSMDECVYFTKRFIKEGKAKTWVFKEKCPECKEGIMGKPRDPKTGKAKMRATEYVCPKCNHTMQKKEYEESLTANISYVCPYCKHEGEIQIPFKRKKVQIINEETGKKKSVEALRFQCSQCSKDIDVTKKMK